MGHGDVSPPPQPSFHHSQVFFVFFFNRNYSIALFHPSYDKGDPFSEVQMTHSKKLPGKTKKKNWTVGRIMKKIPWQSFSFLILFSLWTVQLGSLSRKKSLELGLTFPEEGLNWVGSFPLRDRFSQGLIESLNSSVNDWNLTSASQKRISRPQKCCTLFAIRLWPRNGPLRGNNAVGRVGTYVHFSCPDDFVLLPFLIVFPGFSTFLLGLKQEGPLCTKRWLKF